MCMVDKCEKSKVYARGVCANCYTSFARAVREGKVTADQLESAGMWLPVNKNASGRQSPARKALEKLLSEQE